MSGEVRALVPAKINLCLGVGPRREDGFHELLTVYHAIGLYDEIIATHDDARAGSGSGRVTLTIEGEGADVLPLDRNNLAVRAAEDVAASLGVAPAVRLFLRKRIPIAGGLAGGSADAAATLIACDALLTGRYDAADRGPNPRLESLAAGLGSDVPFLLYGGTAIGTGRGERIEPIVSAGSGRMWHWVVAVAEGGLSTPLVYAELDKLRDSGLAPQPALDASELLAALSQDDPFLLGAALHNDLEVAALSLRPDLRATLDAGLAAGAVAGMVSGSGPTCVFLARDARDAEMIATRMTGIPGCRKTVTAPGPVRGARLMSGPAGMRDEAARKG